MAYTFSIMPGESISDDLSTLNDDASTISKDNSHRRLVSPRRSASIYTVNSTSSARTISLRLFSVKDIVLGSLMLLPIIPRISAARKEFLSIRRSTIPAPLLKHRKLLQDLLKLTRDEMPSHIRKAALRLISYVFEYLVQQIFSGSASAARKQFLSALSELCDDELPYEIREEGLMTFYYIVGAVTSLGRKNFALEFEDCRVIQLHAQTTTQVSLKLCAYSYLILAHSAFADHLYQPVSEAERRVICVCLSELTESPLPLPSIKAALDLLWRFESTLSCGLTFEERTDVWKSILSLSGSKDWNARLQYHSHQTEGIHQKNCHTRHEAALSECFLGLRCLWKFNLLPAWAADMSELHESKKRYIGADLFDLASSANSMVVRRRAFFTIVLFANLSHWEDMYDMSTWRNVNDQFADFCLNDPENVDRDSVVRRVQGIFQSMLEPSEKRIVTTRRELRISKHVSVIIKRDTDQLLALTDTVKKNCGPDLRFEAALENLAVFTMPGESLLIHKDQQAILYERICSYTEYEQTRDIAVQAMFALLTIQEWIKAAEIFESSFEE